jgi:hypothetical protein
VSIRSFLIPFCLHLSSGSEDLFFNACRYEWISWWNVNSLCNWLEPSLSIMYAFSFQNCPTNLTTNYYYRQINKFLVRNFLPTGKWLNGAQPSYFGVSYTRLLLKLNWKVQFNHTWREGNRVADWLANFSFSLNSFNTYIMETPPKEASSLLFDDISKASMPRNIRISM